MTIEERAKSYAKTPFIDAVGTYCDINKFNSYVQGATEQQKIDIEKAGEWLFTVLDCYDFDWDTIMYLKNKLKETMEC